MYNSEFWLATQNSDLLLRILTQNSEIWLKLRIQFIQFNWYSIDITWEWMRTNHIYSYFYLGLTQPEQLVCPANDHCIIFFCDDAQASALERRLRKLTLSRSNLSNLVNNIQKNKFKTLVEHLATEKRDDVATLFYGSRRKTFEKAAKKRKYFSERSNFCRHMDDYNKLKGYGITISYTWCYSRVFQIHSLDEHQ